MKLNLKEITKYTLNTRVLVVEDDVDLNENIKDLLKTLFNDVQVAYNGIEGLAKYQESINELKRFDIIITDINMPKMDGFELISKIRAIDNKQKIIVTTAYDDSHSLVKLIDLHIDRFILKTSIYNNLIRVVADISKEIYNEKIMQLYLNEAKHLKESSNVFFNKKIFTVIAIDDSSTQLFFYKDILKELDITLVTFDNGKDALKHLEKNEAHLILLDVQMPIIDGFEVAKRLSLNEKTCNIPVVFITSVAVESKFVEQGYTLGAVDYIIKDQQSMMSIFNKVKIYSQLFAKQLQLQDFNQQLELKVKEQTIKLEAINMSLENKVQEEIEKNRNKDRLMFQQAKFAAMGEMIANIAHQWRQPLTAISAIIQSIELKNKLSKITPEFITTQTQEAKRIANQMSQTIDDFKNFFKANKATESFKLINIIYDELKILDNVLQTNGIKVIINIDDKRDIIGIKSELFQVILNILNNAKDALNEKLYKDKLVFINVIDGMININDTMYESILISIKDNAGGISDNIIEKIFEPYFTTKHNAHGTGIGLYMSKEIIQKSMYGNIHVENVEYTYQDRGYAGAEFVIEIPRNLNQIRLQDKEIAK